MIWYTGSRFVPVHAMRDLLDQLFASRALRSRSRLARRGMRPKLRRRFYRAASVAECDGFSIVLDGKPVRTPGAAPARGAFPTAGGGHSRRMGGAARRHRPGADAAHAARQRDHRWSSRRSAVGRSGNRQVPELRPSMLPRGRRRRRWSSVQAQAWNPVIDLGPRCAAARTLLSEAESIFVTQPAEALAAARAAIPSDPWRLGALASATGLDRLGAACARAVARPAYRRAGVACSPCRRRLEYGALGPRPARARTARCALCRATGCGAGVAVVVRAVSGLTYGFCRFRVPDATIVWPCTLPNQLDDKIVTLPRHGDRAVRAAPAFVDLAFGDDLDEKHVALGRGRCASASRCN